MNDEQGRSQASRPASRILGSLRDALAAASREDPTKAPRQAAPGDATSSAGSAPGQPAAAMQRQVPSAAEAAREARGGTPNIPPVVQRAEPEAPPTTRVVRAAPPPPAAADSGDRTQLVRGKSKIVRGVFHQDPVVGWVVVVGGPGLGAHRPIFEGNNTVGRSATQRIPIDFGDDSISSEEQAYIRYDSSERSFLFVPNLSKPNVVSVNDKRPTGAVALSAMDLITMGRTQLVFIPFCGPDFDWSEITDATD